MGSAAAAAAICASFRSLMYRSLSNLAGMPHSLVGANVETFSRHSARGRLVAMQDFIPFAAGRHQRDDLHLISFRLARTRTGLTSSASSMTDASASPRMPPNGHCAGLPWAGTCGLPRGRIVSDLGIRHSTLGKLTLQHRPGDLVSAPQADLAHHSERLRLENMCCGKRWKC